MSNPAPPGIYTLTLPDVLRFMQAKGIASSCPVCQQPSLAVAGFGPNEATAALTYSEHPLAGQSFMPLMQPGYAKPVIPLECYNCGHIRLFSYYIVRQWAQNNPTPGSQLFNALTGGGDG